MFASLAKFATLLLAAASAAQASPVKRAALDVWTPVIIEPTLGSVWPVGTVQTLVWSLDTIPESAYGTPGSAYLGYYEDGSDSEHLDLCEYFP